MRYEQFSCNQLTIGAGKGIPAVGAGPSSLVSVSLTPSAVATVTVAKQNVTVPGVDASDIVIPVRDPISTAVALTAANAVSANTVALTFANPTAGSVTPTAGTYTFLVIKTQ